MPQRYSIKKYVYGGYYHVFNRGVEKRAIIEDDNDEKRLLELLFSSAARYNVTIQDYAIMKNHYHLLINQVESNNIERFMHSFGIRYASYYNSKYGRVGHLFQGVYKARILYSARDIETIKLYIYKNKIEREGSELIFE